VPVSSVARSTEPGTIVPGQLSGESLLRVLQDRPTTEYLVVDGDRVVGVLTTADVAAALDRRGHRR